jgi:predicted DCC family thiol-disulfide oxidoreductase YuxK
VTEQPPHAAHSRSGRPQPPQASRPPSPATKLPSPASRLLIFDGDCAFCTSTATYLARRLPPDAAAIPWQHIDLAALGATPDRAQREVLWIDPSGIRGGATAVAAALRTCRPVTWRAVGVALDLPPLRWLAPSAYRLIARNRHRLPGGTPACALDR